MRLNRAWLGALAAMSLAGGLAGPAQATIITNNITGTNSQVDFACLGLIVGFTQNNCYWDGVNPTPFPFTGASGPIQLAGYYAVGNSPWDRNGAPGDIEGTPGDGKLALPLSGTVTIDDKGTPCDADDTITATISYGAAKRNFAGGPGTQGEEAWGDGDLSFDLAETVVDSATPNGGGCDYVIGSAGFPATIPTVNGGANQYGDDVDIGLGPGQLIWEPNDGTNYTGISPSITSVEQGAPNSGAPLTVTNGPGYVCEFFNGAVSPCAAGGAHHEVATGGERAAIENSIWSVSIDAGGNITAARVFPVNEELVGTLGEEEWDSPMWNLTGTCINCGANAADDSASTIVDTPVTIDILANDTGFTDPVTVALPGGGTTTQGGTVVINGTNPGAQNQIDVTYTPPAAFTSPPNDTFDYTINGLTATVTVDVQADLMPVANALTGPAIDTQGVSPDTVSQSVNAFSDGGNSPGNTPASLATSLNAGSAAGTCAANAGTVSFTPAATSFTGSGICDYTITDANGDMASNTATFAIPDVSPTVSDAAGSGTEGSTVAINVTFTAGNGSVAQHTLDAAGSATGGTTANGGTVTVTGVTGGAVQLTYVSAAGFTGDDTFTVTLTDGDGDAATGTVTVTVTADTSGDIQLKLPGGSSAVGPWSLLFLAGLPLLRRRRRH